MGFYRNVPWSWKQRSYADHVTWCLTGNGLKHPAKSTEENHRTKNSSNYYKI